LAEEGYKSARRKNSTGAGAKSSVSLSTAKRVGIAPNAQPKKGQLLTQHTGLPPRKQK
jgi:hypothetical protein